MDSIVITVERGWFPLCKFSVTIGDRDFSLNPTESKEIELPDSDQYEVAARSYFLKKRTQLHLDNYSLLKVEHGLPDIFYGRRFLYLLFFVF